jgi:hypothetical protein
MAKIYWGLKKNDQAISAGIMLDIAFRNYVIFVKEKMIDSLRTDQILTVKEMMLPWINQYNNLAAVDGIIEHQLINQLNKTF